MGKTSLVSNIHLVDANSCVENNALVYIMELAVKNIVGTSNFKWSPKYYFLSDLSIDGKTYTVYVRAVKQNSCINSF